MELQRGKVGLDPGSRPHDAHEIVKRIFSSKSCLECGICCKDEDGLRIKVFGTEPGKNMLMAAARAKSQYCVKPSVFGSFIIQSPDVCVFLEEGAGGKKCSVYDMRPAVCSIFPFMIQETKTTGRNGLAEKKPLVVLTSYCPSVREAKRAGISFIAQDELIECVKEGGGYRITVPMLGESLVRVLECNETKGLFTPDSFLRMPGAGSAVFPIL